VPGPPVRAPTLFAQLLLSSNPSNAIRVREPCFFPNTAASISVFSPLLCTQKRLFSVRRPVRVDLDGSHFEMASVPPARNGAK